MKKKGRKIALAKETLFQLQMPETQGVMGALGSLSANNCILCELTGDQYCA